MKVVISLTSIPSRTDKLAPILENLSQFEIWLNIPRKYERFPNWDGVVPSYGQHVRVNRECEDFGPGTKFLGPIEHLGPDDLMVYIDDDTLYSPDTIENLLKWHRVDPNSAWGLSGFDFELYFQGLYPRRHGVPVDILEGYGSVIVKVEWIRKISDEFKSLWKLAKFADDILVNNLFEKHGIKRKTVCTPACNVGQIRQCQYGFETDALHHQVQGGHKQNYINVLKELEDKGKNYFSYKCS